MIKSLCPGFLISYEIDQMVISVHITLWWVPIPVRYPCISPKAYDGQKDCSYISMIKVDVFVSRSKVVCLFESLQMQRISDTMPEIRISYWRKKKDTPRVSEDHCYGIKPRLLRKRRKKFYTRLLTSLYTMFSAYWKSFISYFSSSVPI